MHIAYFRLGARKLIDIYGVTLVTVDVVSERCENSVQVRRAAGAGEYGDTGRDGEILPRELTAFEVYFERIFVEEGFSVKRQSGDHAVVQDSLYYVGVHGIVFKAHHAVSEEHQGNGCTGLGIRQVVAQIVCIRKRFSGTCRTDSAGHIHFSADNIVEKRLAGIIQLLVVCFICEIRHCGIQIAGSYAVPYGTGLLSYGQMALIVRSSVTVENTSAVYKERRKIKEFLFAGRAVHADQRKLDLLMTGS